MGTTAFVYLNDNLPATPQRMEAAKARVGDWQTPARAFATMTEGYAPGDPLVMSECAFTSDSDNTLALAAGIMRILNDDERPNGARERSLSVGDLICFMDDDGQESWYTAKPVGFNRLDEPPDLSTLIKPTHIHFHTVGVGYA